MIKPSKWKTDFNEAIEKGFIGFNVKEHKEPKMPELNVFGLRFPEKHAKTPEDYMRLSF